MLGAGFGVLGSGGRVQGSGGRGQGAGLREAHVKDWTIEISGIGTTVLRFRRTYSIERPAYFWKSNVN